MATETYQGENIQMTEIGLEDGNGNQQADNAIENARNARRERKKKWILFFLIVIILLIVPIVIVVLEVVSAHPMELIDIASRCTIVLTTNRVFFFFFF